LHGAGARRELLSFNQIKNKDSLPQQLHTTLLIFEMEKGQEDSSEHKNKDAPASASG